MNTTRYRVRVSGSVGASPSRVYAVIADYRQHHPRIVPPRYFPRLEVLAGGVGAGTRTRVEMRVLGSTRGFEQVISEPEPGRVLMESEPDGFSVTTFTVEEADFGAATRVTIVTDLVARPGPGGLVERLVTSAMLRRIYRAEIALLGQYLAGPHSFATPDKNTTVCIDDGPDEQAIRDAARANNMPADEIFEVPNAVLPR
jgi:hypothetical protein